MRCLLPVFSAPAILQWLFTYPAFATASTSSLPDTSKASVNDCSKAIEITDTVFGPTKISTLFEGNTYIKGEFYDEHSMWLQRGWYRFTLAEDAYIAFDIVPESGKDDYDFLLFKYTGEKFCEAINKKNVHSLRKCLSQDFSNGSRTGLSASSGPDTSQVGDNPPYCRGLSALAGETYYLYIAFAPSGSHLPFTIHLHFPVKPFASPVVLKNVLFETASAKLLPSSFDQLDKLAERLKKNPGIKIELSGHTDNRGNEKANLRLSEDRARAVVIYLAAKGVNEKKLSYKGYGSSKPVASNDSEEGRQQNRRVEFTIISE